MEMYYGSVWNILLEHMPVSESQVWSKIVNLNI